MQIKNASVLAASAVLSAALVSSAMVAPAGASKPHEGNRSLAKVLAADGNRFDKNPGDFDVLEKAVVAVLKEKPDSAVKVLTQGKKRLTAFLPTDRAFRVLVKDLTGSKPKSEKATFNKLAAAAGVDAIETVLLYHVVPGATITKKQALGADGAELGTAQGGSVTVEVKGKKVKLIDADPDDRNARIVAFDINKGNKQIGHAVKNVLRPFDL
ncbi:MAG: fasciclin domain-containing protein [Nocardioides sp.]